MITVAGIEEQIIQGERESQKKQRKREKLNLVQDVARYNDEEEKKNELDLNPAFEESIIKEIYVINSNMM